MTVDGKDDPADGDCYTDPKGSTWEWVEHEYAALPCATLGHWKLVQPVDQTEAGQQHDLLH